MRLPFLSSRPFPYISIPAIPSLSAVPFYLYLYSPYPVSLLLISASQLFLSNQQVPCIRVPPSLFLLARFLMFSDFSPSHFSSCLTLSTSSLLFFLILHGHSFILSAGCYFFTSPVYFCNSIKAVQVWLLAACVYNPALTQASTVGLSNHHSHCIRLSTILYPISVLHVLYYCPDCLYPVNILLVPVSLPSLSNQHLCC